MPKEKHSGKAMGLGPCVLCVCARMYTDMCLHHEEKVLFVK
jgi:hypothetical protein